MNGQAATLQQLQTQVAQLLITVQNMQEQFSEVVKELSEVKRTSNVHQAMLKDAAGFLKPNSEDPDQLSYDSYDGNKMKLRCFFI